MSEARIYQLPAEQTLTGVAYALERFLREEKSLEAEGLSVGEDSYFIQARQTDGWKKFVGMDQAIQVRLSVYSNMLTVDLGAGRWVDKLGAATLGYIIFSPLLLTAAIGAIGQQRLPQEIFDFVQRYTFLGKPLDINDFAPKAPEAPEEPAPLCPSCGAALPEGAKFCPGCGKPAAQKRTCPVCGAAPSVEGARFCAECGAPLN